MHTCTGRAPRRSPAEELPHEPWYVYFGSGAGVYALSNFCALEKPFEFRGLHWSTSEHAYQAIFRCEEESWPRFAVGGDLSTLETGAPLVFGVKDVSRKVKHWGAKKSGRSAMTGIVAKMAVKMQVASKIGVRLKRNHEEGQLTQIAVGHRERVMIIDVIKLFASAAVRR